MKIIDIKMEIICKNFEQLNIEDNTIYVTEQSEEYYIIPLNKSYSLESDDEVMKLTFDNQLLWLKYSNHNQEIHLNEYDFTECVVIKSSYIMDIYLKIDSTNYLKKNVWQSRNNMSLNKSYLGKYVLVIPIIENMFNVFEYGEGIRYYQMEVITNEVLMKRVRNRGNNNGYVVITNNIVQSDEALVIMLNDDDVDEFIGF